MQVLHGNILKSDSLTAVHHRKTGASYSLFISFMTESKDLIITASCGKNLELSEKFLEKSIEMKLSSEILDLTTLDIPLFNPRIHNKENIPPAIKKLKSFSQLKNG